MRNLIPTIRKALLAAGFTGIAAIGTAMLDGDITRKEGLIAAGMGLVAGAATYRVPNAEAGE
jgi:hypothetical protein